MKNTGKKLVIVVLVTLLLLVVNILNKKSAKPEILDRQSSRVDLHTGDQDAEPPRNHRADLENLFEILKEEGDLDKIEDILVEISQQDPDLESSYENLEGVKVARYIRLVEKISQSEHIRESVKRDFTRLSLTTYSELSAQIDKSTELSMGQKIEYSESALADLVDIASAMNFSSSQISQFIAEGFHNSPDK